MSAIFPKTTKKLFSISISRRIRGRLTVVDDRKRKIPHTVLLPDLGTVEKNDKLAALISEFASKAVEIIDGGE